jgi:hypothetical protein
MLETEKDPGAGVELPISPVFVPTADWFMLLEPAPPPCEAEPVFSEPASPGSEKQKPTASIITKTAVLVALEKPKWECEREFVIGSVLLSLVIEGNTGQRLNVSFVGKAQIEP